MNEFSAKSIARRRRLPVWLGMLILVSLVAVAARVLTDSDALEGVAYQRARLPSPGREADGWAVTPIVPFQDLSPDQIALGRRLFHDPLLSRDRTVSCSTCHPLERGGSDGRPRSIGVGGVVGRRNAPTVLNAGLAFRQFWDGRAVSLESQIDGPINEPGELGSSWPEVTSRLRQDSHYQVLFQKLYGGVSAEAVRHAIATFERSLTTPNSRFDQYLRGDIAALTPVELSGWRMFQKYGCVSCHQGSLLGGNMFEKLGAVAPLHDDSSLNRDLGRYLITGQEPHRNEFKVPTLRNVEVTAPYFHDGSVETLEDAVRIMAKSQLGVDLPESDLKAILAFLKTLTAPVPGDGR